MATPKTTAKPKAKKAPKAAAPATGASKTVKFQDFTISTKRSGRYLVTGKNGKPVNGADKSKILVDAKLVKPSLPKKADATEEAAPTT